jgi:hypothetical protein
LLSITIPINHPRRSVPVIYIIGDSIISIINSSSQFAVFGSTTVAAFCSRAVSRDLVIPHSAATSWKSV